MADLDHKDITEAFLHEPKGVSTATAGQAYLADGAGSGVWTNLETGNKVILISSLADLPDISGGAYPLAANTSYRFVADVNLGTNYLLFANGTDVSSVAFGVSTITYTGTAPMMQGADANATIKDITINCPNANVYAWHDTTPATSIVIIQDVLILACKTVGVFNDVNTLVTDGSTVVDCTDGFVFLGTAQVGCRLVSVNIFSTSTSFVGLDFTGSLVQAVNLDGIILEGGAGSIGLKGDAGSANIAANFEANVSNVQFQGVTTPLSGITIDDVRWNFQGNGDILDTMPDALVSLNSNAVATVISTINTPVLAAGTWVCERQSHFTCTTAGRATYIGEKNIISPVDIVATMDMASGTNKDVTMYLALNGTIITNSGQHNRISSGTPRNTSVVWQLELSPNDYLELYVENNSDTVNITVQSAVLRVR